MNMTLYRLWRGVIVTVFLLLAVGCKGRDVSGDAAAVDALTVEYIFTDLAKDIKAADSTICEVERVKLTRQDAIPIALVNVRYSNGSSGREFYGFNYLDIAQVAEMLDNNPQLTATDVAQALHYSQCRALALLTVARRAKGMK